MASKGGSSSVLYLDKGSKNKRKLPEPSQMKPVSLPTSLTELPRYQQSLEKPRNPLCDLPLPDVGSSQGKEVAEGGECESGEWEDPIVCALEELLSSGLHTLFRNAIDQIVVCGYSEDDAIKNIARRSLYCGGKELVSNIVNDTLSVLKKGKGSNSSRDEVFDNLELMVDYSMLEMIIVLREVKTSLSIAEAMWWLLMCDLNISQACTVEGDLLSFLDSKEVSGESFSNSSPSRQRSEGSRSGSIPSSPSKSNVPRPSKPTKPFKSSKPVKCSMPETLKFGSFPNLPNPRNPVAAEEILPERDSLVSMTGSVEKSLISLGERVQNMSLTLASEERSGSGQKWRSKKELATLHQKSHRGHIEKTYSTYGKGDFKSGKLANIGGFVVEKRVRPVFDVPAVHSKSGSSNISAETGAAAASSRDGGHCASTITPRAHPVSDSPSTIPTKGTIYTVSVPNTGILESSSLKKNPAAKAVVTMLVSPKIPDYYAGLPFDETLGRHVPQNEKDELILKLVPRCQELQNELNSWTEWANQKVMQAARRLSKDQAELKSLRLEKQEAEQCQTDKQILEENTMKRLSEMESALNNATCQVEGSNSNVRRLEVEHSLLKKEMEAAKLWAVESAASIQEAFEREKKALKNTESLEGQRVLLRQELATAKQKLAELQQEISRAQNRHNQLEARRIEERMAKENLLAQAAAIRNEREQLKAAAEVEEEMIKLKAEKEVNKYTEDIKKSESQLSLLKFESYSSKIAALRRSVDGSFGGFMPVSKIENPAMKGNQIPGFSMGEASSSSTGGLKREQECVMCLSEEKSVVFLPCAHQVLCQKCNELHEKQGMNDCPSCRTPIQRRIEVRFDLS